MNYTFESLKNYALWYYFKYFPSSNKLISKLEYKSKDIELSKKVYDDINHLIDEKAVISDKIRLFLFRNKNLNYIKSKLIIAWFEKELVNEILQNQFIFEDKSLLNEKSLRIKIQNYKSKWKSIAFIKQTFIERNADIELVENIINEIFTDWEDEIIIKEIEKLKWKYEIQKIIQKMISKWFSYNLIKKYV